MKRILLLLAAAAAPGCLNVDALGWRQPTVEAPKPPPPAPPAVQPEEVNAGNAAAKLEALRAEIEYDARERPAR